MPIYEFRCASCGQVTEALISQRSEHSDQVCCHCGGKDLTRIMSSFSTSAPQTEAEVGGSCCGSSTPCSTPGHCCAGS